MSSQHLVNMMSATPTCGAVHRRWYGTQETRMKQIRPLLLHTQTGNNGAVRDLVFCVNLRRGKKILLCHTGLSKLQNTRRILTGNLAIAHMQILRWPSARSIPVKTWLWEIPHQPKCTIQIQIQPKFKVSSSAISAVWWRFRNTHCNNVFRFFYSGSHFR